MFSIDTESHAFNWNELYIDFENTSRCSRHRSSVFAAFAYGCHKRYFEFNSAVHERFHLIERKKNSETSPNKYCKIIAFDSIEIISLCRRVHGSRICTSIYLAMATRPWMRLEPSSEFVSKDLPPFLQIYKLSR